MLAMQSGSAKRLGHLTMLPLLVDHRPAMARNRDVLPTPLGPVMSRDSP